MAKRHVSADGVNRSAAIREILASAPKTPVKDIVATLSKRGVTVNPNLVYLIKSKLAHQKHRQSRQRALEAYDKAGVSSPVELILKVRQLASQAGGYGNLKKLVDVLAD